MATGTIEIGGGGILDATGIGAVAGVPMQVIGGATVIHGTITGANTAQNIRQDKLLNQSNKETPNSKPAIEAQTSQNDASKGKLEIEPGRTLSPAEQRIADKLVAEGKEVNAPKEINQQNVKNPDFDVDGINTELKTITDLKGVDSDKLSKGLSGRILEAGNQATNVIIDISEQAGMTKEIAERAINRAYGFQKKFANEKIQEIRIVGKDFDFTSTYSK